MGQPEGSPPAPRKRDVGAGRIMFEFSGSINLNGFGTTMAVGGLIILLWIIATAALVGTGVIQ